MYAFCPKAIRSKTASIRLQKDPEMITVRTLTASGLAICMLFGAAGALAGRHKHQLPQPTERTATAAANAVIDMEAVYNQSGARDSVEQRGMTEVRASANQRLKLMEGAPFLTPQERVELIDLAGIAQPSAAQLERMKALQALSDQRSAELQQLQTKKDADLAASDKARMRELLDEQNALEQVTPGIEMAAQNEVQRRIEELRHAQIVRIRAVVAQIAKEKGYTNVYDAATLVYSANDITSQVLQRLEKERAR
jgi:Skp family chaperone for outer membrane proteins